MSTPSRPAAAPAAPSGDVGAVLVLSERAMFRRAFARLVESVGRACEPAAAVPARARRFELVLADLADVDAASAGPRAARLIESVDGVRTACVIDHPDAGAVDALMAAGSVGVLVKASPPTALTEALALLLAGESCRPAPTVAVAPDALPEAVRARLSARERRMLRLIAGGESIPSVAAALHLTSAKVVTDVRRIMDVVRGRA